MAKFLNADATALHLADLILHARERLVLMNPELKFSGRTKELLAKKDALDDVHVVFGRSQLHPEDINWLRAHPFVRTHLCRSLTAKCYLNETACIVTSLDLFDFGQLMNSEMGVLISRESDRELFHDAAEEAQRILQASEEVRIRVDRADEVVPSTNRASEGVASSGKVSTHRLAKKLGLKTHELLDGLQRLGAIEVAAGQKQLTPHGLKLGGEFRSSARFGSYFVWPENFELAEVTAPANGH